MKVILERAVPTRSANRLDKPCFQALDSDRSILGKGQLHLRVLLVEALEEFDLLSFRLGYSVFWEVAISEEG